MLHWEGEDKDWMIELVMSEEVYLSAQTRLSMSAPFVLYGGYPRAGCPVGSPPSLVDTKPRAR